MPGYQLLPLLALLAADTQPAMSDTPDSPPVARVEVVHDRHFGVSVPDPYRWMEAQDGEFDDYLRAQNDYTRAVFERLAAPRQALLERIRELQEGTARIRFVQRAGEHFFFLETPASSNRALLVQRHVNNNDKRVLVRPEQFDIDDRKASIDFIQALPDGRYVAFVVAHAGAENWTLHVVDTGSGKLLDDRIAMIANPFPSWRADGNGFYYSRLRDYPAGVPESQRYDNIRIHFHALGTDTDKDEAVFGPGVIPGLEIPGKASFPDLIASADGRYLVAMLSRGTDYYARALWIRDLQDETSRWRKIADHDDHVSAVQVHGNSVYVINSKGAPNGQVLRFDAKRETIADARTILPEGRTIVAAENGTLRIAKDALYVLGQRNGFGTIRRIEYAENDITELALPANGVIIEFTTGHDATGACFGLQSPTLSSRIFCHDPAGDSITDARLTAADPADYSGVTMHRANIDSTDGVRVPLTLIGPEKLKHDGSNPVLLTVYGSYGAIVPMWFAAPNLAWYERGGMIVFVHARGGGEKGAEWHQAARKTRKQKTVDDTLAAARWLVDEGYTSPHHLAIAGKSAGGIPVGAAITQHPELFRAALFRVGVTDMLRLEQGRTGPANVAEYGSITIEEEFRALHAISPYANIHEDVNYPAVMLETGINDPRVPPWQLAKMTARLQAATASELPVLLRVDYAGGHGLGTDKSQAAELLADEYTFLGWQLDMAGFELEGGNRQPGEETD